MFVLEQKDAQNYEKFINYANFFDDKCIQIVIFPQKMQINLLTYRKYITFVRNFDSNISIMVKRVEENFTPIWELNPIWDILTEEQKQWVNNDLEVVYYAKNAIIHQDGDESDYMWMLLSGKVRIYKEGIGQRQQIIRLLKPYDLFGYRAVIADEPYNSSASAFEPCTVYRLSNECFRRLVSENGQFCYQVLLTMAKDLAISEIQTVNLTQKHIRGRLAESLLQLRRNYGYESDGCTLAMLMPREDLANMSNMTTSNAIRTLSQFAQEGLVAVDGRRIQILNEPELERVSRLG